MKNELVNFNVSEFNTKASLHFSDIEDLYNALKLLFGLYPIEYQEQRVNVINWLNENKKGYKFYIDQIIFKVTK